MHAIGLLGGDNHNPVKSRGSCQKRACLINLLKLLYVNIVVNWIEQWAHDRKVEGSIGMPNLLF